MQIFLLGPTPYSANPVPIPASYQQNEYDREHPGLNVRRSHPTSTPATRHTLRRSRTSQIRKRRTTHETFF
jgi:hypothetical protein